MNYGSKKVKAKSLNWYQQASIVIHLIVDTMAINAEVRQTLEEKYRLQERRCITRRNNKKSRGRRSF